MERLRIMDGDAPDGLSEQQLRRNVVALMEWRGMTQAELADELGQSQSWVSRRLSGKDWTDGGSRFQFSDLDGLCRVFGLSPWELLQPGHGNWDRRRADERRTGTDRRRSRTRPLTTA